MLACRHGETFDETLGRPAELPGFVLPPLPEVREGLAGPFYGHKLSGADVYWLVQQVSESSQNGNDYGTAFSSLLLQGADLSEAHLEKAELQAAHLEGANLHLAVLRGANLNRGYLEKADLSAAIQHGRRPSRVWAGPESAQELVRGREGELAPGVSSARSANCGRRSRCART